MSSRFVVVHNSRYADVPPMPVTSDRDLAELRAELVADGVKPSQIRVFSAVVREEKIDALAI